ncbi:MAG: MaoC family dehydratase N-terminal domain-containing protein [Chloroflexi bacterium]|nr:MaoC family dehydratase N-terminal domain-containing protein [Chloroflexota bacterium]
MTAIGHSGDALITPEALAALKARIGVEFPTKPWNTVASVDTMRHFAEGIGDSNPLLTNPDYGAASRWGAMIAAPTYLNTFSNASFSAARAGLPGVFALWAGGIWTFERPVVPGDRITATEKLVSVEEKPSRWGGRAIHQVLQTTYRDASGRLVGSRVGRIVRAERPRARKQGKYAEASQKYRYSDAELAAIERDYDAEQVRGAQPRFWEDVSAADALGHVVKGPLTSTDIVTFLMGWGSPLCKAHSVAHQYMRRHPGAAIIDPETNVRDFAEAAHWDEALARRSGVFAGYDIGEQRIAWCSHLLTNWMGDDALLRRLEVRLRRPNFLGDTTWVRGRIADRLVREGEHLVACELWAENQHGERNVDGTAMVWLPSRADGTWPALALRARWGQH